MTAVTFIGWFGLFSVLTGFAVATRTLDELPSLDLAALLRANGMFFGGFGLLTVWAVLWWLR